MGAHPAASRLEVAARCRGGCAACLGAGWYAGAFMAALEDAGTELRAAAAAAPPSGSSPAPPNDPKLSIGMFSRGMKLCMALIGPGPAGGGAVEALFGLLQKKGEREGQPVFKWARG